MNGFYYLASPYSHPSALVRHERYLAALDCQAWFLRNRVWVYSPIVHCYETTRLYDLPGDAQFWRDYDRTMIDAARGLWVLSMDGLENSVGVQDEISYARKIGHITEFVIKDGRGGYDRV